MKKTRTTPAVDLALTGANMSKHKQARFRMRRTRVKTDRHTGSTLDSLLKADGLLDEIEAVAIKRVIAWQLATTMNPISLRVAWLLRPLRSVFTRMARSIMSRTALRNCLIVMAGVYASPSRAGDSEELERWSQEFTQLALDAELGPANGYVNKWVGEVRYSIESRPRRSIIDEMVIGQFDRLQGVTGLKYVRTTGQDASFRVLYLSSTERLAWLDDLTSQAFQQHLEKWHSAPNSP